MSREPSMSARRMFGSGSIKSATIPQRRSPTHLKTMDKGTPDSSLIEALRARLGPHGVLTDPANTAPYCEDWRRLYHGHTPAVLRAATGAGVAEAGGPLAQARGADRPPGRATRNGGGAGGQQGRAARVR